MKLTIAAAAIGVILRFTTPEPGTYYVYSEIPGSDKVYMEAAGYNPCPVHVAVPMETSGTHKLFWIYFIPTVGEQTHL